MPAAQPGPDDPPRRLSPLKWAAGFLFFIAFMIGGALVGFWLSGGPKRPLPPTVAPAAVPPGVFIVLAVIGGVFVFVGGALYGLLLLTNCFTFDYTRPFLTSFKVKQWVGNLLVGLFIQCGLALMMAPGLMSLLLPVLPAQFAGIVSFFGPFVLLQFFSTWLNLWPGVMRSMTTRRLMRLGIPSEALASGAYVGVSDPGKNSFKKMSLVEEDLGVLWLHPAGLSYRGDSMAWDVPRDRVVGLERRADAGSVSAYFGAVAVILCYRDEAGGERRLRLHAAAGWTMTTTARRQDELAARIRMWMDLPPESAPLMSGPAAAAFPVVGTTIAR